MTKTKKKKNKDIRPIGYIVLRLRGWKSLTSGLIGSCSVYKYKKDARAVFGKKVDLIPVWYWAEDSQ